MVYFPEGYTPIVLTKSRSVKIYFIFLDYSCVSYYYYGNKASIKAHTTKYLLI